MTRVVRIDTMARAVRKIVKTEYYYTSDSDSDSESDATTVIFDDEDWEDEESDDEDGSDYESETESESDEEELDDPKPYFGKGFRVYFDSHADKKFFMKAFGFYDT